MRPAVIALILLAGGVASAHAELVFEKTELSFRPVIGETRISGEFRFKNTGTKPVSITRAESGCLCTVAEKPAAAIAPGAEGGLPFVLKFGEHVGSMAQSIEVETSDGRHQTLRVTAQIPARVQFAPRLLVFRGAEADAKTAVLTYAAETKSELIDVTLSSAAFELVGSPRMEKDGALKIALRHAGAADADARGAARVRTRDGAGAEHTDILYLRHTP